MPRRQSKLRNVATLELVLDDNKLVIIAITMNFLIESFLYIYGRVKFREYCGVPVPDS